MTQNSSIIQDFTTGKITGPLITFAMPLFLSNLLQIVYNMVDMVIVGQAEGGVGLSAVAVGGDIAHFLLFLAIGFAGAGQVIIAQYVGAGERRRAARFIGTLTVFFVIISLCVTVIALIFRENFLHWMNTPIESWDGAMAYSTTCAVGLVFIYGYNMVSAILRGLGNSRYPFIFVSLAAVLNIILDIIFVFSLRLSAFGAALATVISQGVSLLCSVVFLFHIRERIGLDFSRGDFCLDRAMLSPLIKLGIPMAIKASSIQVSKLFVNSWVYSSGVIVAAVTGIANKLNSVCFLVSQSIDTAAASMVGQNIGAQKYDRVLRIISVNAAIMFSVAAFLSLILYLFPVQIIQLFTQDISILPVAMQIIPLTCLNFLGAATRAPMNALMNGSGNYHVNFAVAILDGIVMRVGLSLLLGLWLNLGYSGFWYGDALAGFTPLAIGIVFLSSGAWKKRQLVMDN